MKNQYFGDVNDYRKYGLIRALTGQGMLRSMICWMLTEDDGRPDGGKLDYLLKPNSWRGYDEELFDTIREAVVVQGERSVHVAKEKDIFPGADYDETLLYVGSTRACNHLINLGTPELIYDEGVAFSE